MKSNKELLTLISDLKEASRKEGVKIWRAIAKELESPARNRRVVNISKINKLTKENDNVIVPGKVLATGSIGHKVSISAYQFSESAKKKIAGIGTTLSIQDLLKKNPKGKKLRIIG